MEFAEDGGEVDIETPDDLPTDSETEMDEAIATISSERRQHVIEMREADLRLNALTNQMNSTDD